MTRALFITWDGPGVNYLESLFLPIFSVLRPYGYRFNVLQFTWGDRSIREESARAARMADIGYQAVPVMHRPLLSGTAATLAYGSAYLRSYLRRHATDIVLPRSIMPAAMTLLAVPQRDRSRVVFDADGLPADERVEFGGWNSTGASYRIWRDVEAQAVRAARTVITRTEAAKRILVDRGGAGIEPDKVFAIPNPKNENTFHPRTAEARSAARRRWNIPPDVPWLVFVGSIGTQYHPEEILNVYQRVLDHRPDARLHLITRAESAITPLIQRRNFPPGQVWCAPLDPSKVAEVLSAADVGICFRTPSFSQRAVSPIKIAEYLLCGLPVLTNRGIGDVDDWIVPDVGLLLEDLAPATLASAAHWILDVLRRRDQYRTACRRRGLELFELRRCAAAWAQALAGPAQLKG